MKNIFEEKEILCSQSQEETLGNGEAGPMLAGVVVLGILIFDSGTAE